MSDEYNIEYHVDQNEEEGFNFRWTKKSCKNYLVKQDALFSYSSYLLAPGPADLPI
jgi:hypothetical protein